MHTVEKLQFLFKNIILHFCHFLHIKKIEFSRQKSTLDFLLKWWIYFFKKWENYNFCAKNCQNPTFSDYCDKLWVMKCRFLAWKFKYFLQFETLKKFTQYVLARKFKLIRIEFLNTKWTFTTVCTWGLPLI